MAEEVDMRFRDRRDAGRRLAEVVRHADLGGGAVAVLGLPRGGVPVAFEIARALRAPLDVIVVRKLGVPFQPELAMGAIGEEGVRVENWDVLQSTALTSSDLDAVEARVSAPSCVDVPSNTGRGVLGSICMVGAPSSSTTGSQRVRQCVLRARSRVFSAPPVSWWPFRSPRARRSPPYATSATRS